MGLKKRPENVYRGIGVSPGVKIATVRVLKHRKLNIKQKRIDNGAVLEEIDRLIKAADAAKEQIIEIKSKVDQVNNSNHYFILEAHQLMLEDTMLADQIISHIRDHHFSAEWALKLTVDQLKEQFAEMDDEVFNTRGRDVSEVGLRVFLQGSF